MIRKWFRAVSAKKAKAFALAFVLPLALCRLSAWLAKDAALAYGAALLPPFAPPAETFFFLWNLAYLFGGAAAYLLLVMDAEKPAPEIRDALKTGAVSFLLCALWPALLFGWQWRLTAVFTLVLLWIVDGAASVKYYRLRPWTALFTLPRWTFFAYVGYLNLGVYILNR